MFISWLDFSSSLFSNNFPVQPGLGVSWNLGFSILVLFTIQIISGVFLSFYVDVNLLSCLDSKMYLIKEVNYGWLISYLHTVTPTFLFLFIYLHIVNNLLNPVYSFLHIWVSGIFLYLLFIIISFSGYSLVSGSMGYWAIVVVSNIFQFIFGDYIVDIMFYDSFNGGISSLSIYKIFTYHYIISIVTFMFIFVHIWFLHSGGSTGVFSYYYDHFGFFLTTLFNDFIVIFYIILMLIISVCFYPEYFFSYDNYSEVNIYMVPEEINSEWYLSLFFITLSATNSNIFGVFSIVFILSYVMLIPMVSDLFGCGLLTPSCFIYFMFNFVGMIILSFYFYGNSIVLVSLVLFLIFLVTISFVIFEFLSTVNIIYPLWG